MSAFLYRLGRSSARHPFRVLGLWLVAAIAVMALQGSAGGQFDNSDRVPGVESQHAADVLTRPVPEPGRPVRPHRAPHRRRATRRRRPRSRPSSRPASSSPAGHDVAGVTDPFGRAVRRASAPTARRPTSTSPTTLDKLTDHAARRRHGRQRDDAAPAVCRSSSPVRSPSSRRRTRAAS